MLGRQYDLTDVNDKAEAAYDRAYNLNPAYKAKIPEYGNFLLKAKKFDKALALVEAIKNDDKLKFDHFVIKGKALMEKGEYAAAIESLSEGNRIYNSDVGLLNALGTCFSKTGQKEDALKILNASLKLNPNQEEVKKLVAELGRK
jgi:tetratricopeptide (TPR) repeat protein